MKKKFVVGSYHVEKKIGQGGMGEVFLAYDSRAKRHVALKRIRSDKKNDERTKAHFLQEVALCSSLTHPNIIPIYSIEQEGEFVYYTMPYIEGKTLKERILEGKTSVMSFLPIFMQILCACLYVHSKGILHRDLKPSNIMVGANGEVTILDWGLAVRLQESVDPKRLAGSVPYMAPEVVLGEGANYHSEVYSLGLILYEMLTLRFPFHRTSVEQFQQSLTSELLVEPQAVAPDRHIPDFVSKIAMKCLLPEVSERYQRVEELYRDLKSYLEKSDEWVQIEADGAIPKNIRLCFEVEWGERSAIDLLVAPYRVAFSEEATSIEGSSVQIAVKPGCAHKVCIERVDNRLSCFVDDVLQFLTKDFVLQGDTNIKLDAPFRLYTRGRDLHARPRDLPDALLIHGHLAQALAEYRRLGCKFDAALTAFAMNDRSEIEALHGAVGCIARAIMAKSDGDDEKEAYWIEYALQHYPKPCVQDYLVSRVNGLFQLPRKSRFIFAFLVYRYLADKLLPLHTKNLLARFQEELEPLYLFSESVPEVLATPHILCQLAFWLNFDEALVAIIDEMMKLPQSPVLIVEEAFYCLVALGQWQKVQEKLDSFSGMFLDIQATAKLGWIQLVCDLHQRGKIDLKLFSELPPALTREHFRPIICLLEEALNQNNRACLDEMVEALETRHKLSLSQKMLLESYQLFSALIVKDEAKAAAILQGYSLEEIKQNAMIAFLYGGFKLLSESSTTQREYVRLFEENGQKRLAEAFLWEKEQIHQQAKLLRTLFTLTQTG